jgi:hypothetical protein
VYSHNNKHAYAGIPGILQILKEGSLFGELNNLSMKIAFFNATSSPKKNGSAGLLSPAESEIWPANQTGKLRTGLRTIKNKVIMNMQAGISDFLKNI